MKKYILEGLGTFFLLLSLQLGTTAGAPWAYGAVLSGMIYIGYAYSGAHFNPAFSLGLLMHGRISRDALPYYMVMQLGGAFLAAFCGYFLMACEGKADVILFQYHDPLCTLPAEFLGSFVFSLVFISIQRTEHDPARMALICGVTLVGLVYMLKPLAAGIFNPALAFGLCIAGMLQWSDLWIYIVGPLVGSAAAASVWQWIKEDEL